MVSAFQLHVPGFGKMNAHVYAEKIWTVGPTSTNTEILLANVEEGKKKDTLRSRVRAVPAQPRPPAPPAPALPAPYGAIRAGGFPRPRVEPYGQPQMNPI